MARVLVTGSRRWVDVGVVEGALLAVWDEAVQAGFDGIVLVHGGCPTGVDAQAAAWARRNGVSAEGWIAEWELQGRAAGPLRNQRMVDAGADLALAFPLGKSRGTRDCVARAERAGIPVRRFEGAQR